MVKYQEENSKKDYEFRCVCKPCFVTDTHIHEYSEMLYVRSGTMTLFIDGKTRIVPEGHLVFIFPNQTHKYTKRTACELWIAVFSNDFLSAFFSAHPNMRPQDPVVEMQNDHALIDQLRGADPKDITRIAGLLHLLFSVLEKSTVFVQAEPSDDDIYNAALGYIGRNFKNNITLADMAKALGYHEKYLSSALHSLTKMHFRTFLATYRINHAKTLLYTTEMTVAEIALESGFSAINTFNRVFKRITGMTPSKYRKGRH